MSTAAAKGKGCGRRGAQGSHPGVGDEGAGPVAEQVDEQLEDEDEAEGEVELVRHLPQLRRRPAPCGAPHEGKLQMTQS